MLWWESCNLEALELISIYKQNNSSSTINLFILPKILYRFKSKTNTIFSPIYLKSCIKVCIFIKVLQKLLFLTKPNPFLERTCMSAIRKHFQTSFLYQQFCLQETEAAEIPLQIGYSYLTTPSKVLRERESLKMKSSV